MTIHRIGKKPNAAPSVPASSVCPIGIPYTSTATTMATASDTSDATQAVTRSTPSSTNSSNRGIAATSELHARDSATGSRTCWYTSDPDVRSVACLKRVPRQRLRLTTQVLRRSLGVRGRLAVQVAQGRERERDEAEQQHRQREGKECHVQPGGIGQRARQHQPEGSGGIGQ